MNDLTTKSMTDTIVRRRNSTRRRAGHGSSFLGVSDSIWLKQINTAGSATPLVTVHGI